MKPRRLISAILGLGLTALGVYLFTLNRHPACLVPCAIGVGLLYLGWRPGRTSVIVFGHVCVVVGCFLVTLGVYSLPSGKPTLALVFGQPLFWGLFSIFGGICAIYHGFCRCVSGGRFGR